MTYTVSMSPCANLNECARACINKYKWNWKNCVWLCVFSYLLHYNYIIEVLWIFEGQWNNETDSNERTKWSRMIGERMGNQPSNSTCKEVTSQHLCAIDGMSNNKKFKTKTKTNRNINKNDFWLGDHRLRLRLLWRFFSNIHNVNMKYEKETNKQQGEDNRARAHTIFILLLTWAIFFFSKNDKIKTQHNEPDQYIKMVHKSELRHQIRRRLTWSQQVNWMAAILLYFFFLIREYIVWHQLNMRYEVCEFV